MHCHHTSSTCRHTGSSSNVKVRRSQSRHSHCIEQNRSRNVRTQPADALPQLSQLAKERHGGNVFPVTVSLQHRAAGSGQRTKATYPSSGPTQVLTVPPIAGAFLGRPQVPKLGLGLAALGRPGYINLGHAEDLHGKQSSVEDMEHHCHEMLDAAWNLGIRYFDAARSYGLAEKFLSSWLASRAIEPAAVVVGSKWGYTYTADWQVDMGGQPHEVKEHSAENLRKQSGESDALLGRYLNLYQIHSATLESGVLDNQEVIAELAGLKQRTGLRIGLSLSGVQQSEILRKAMAVTMPGDPSSRLFDCVQATWNLMEQAAGGALREAHEAGMDVIIKEAMANGRLTERNTAPEFAPSLQLLQRIAGELGVGVDAVALAAVLVQPFHPMVLSGATTEQQLSANMAGHAAAPQLSPAALAELMGVCRHDSAAYWAERSGMAWN